MRRVVLQLDALASIAGVAVGGLASIASGLFSMASAAAQAGPALIVIPSALGALIQAGAGTMLAFRGIGDAFKAGTQAATGNAAGTRAAASAQRAAASAAKAAGRAVEDARRGVADAYEAASRRIENAQDGVVRAERNLTEAQQRARQAQEDINRAREDAADRLRDLDFALRRGSISEQEAILRVQEAQEALFDAQNMEVDGRTRKKRELDYKSAVLSLEEIRARNEDLQEQQEEAARTGVEGSAEVVAAKQREADANQAVVDAQQNLLKAQRDLQRAQRDSARDIEDAQRRVAVALERQQEAMQRVAEAATRPTSGVNKFAQAMDNLSPAAQRFVRHLLAVRDEYKKVSDAAAAGLFDHLIDASNTLIRNGSIDLIADALRRTTDQVGLFAVDLANLTSNPFFRGNLQTVLNGNIRSLEDFRVAGVALIDYFTALFAAADPLISRFTDWIAKLALARQGTLDTGDEMSAMTEKFNHAGDIAAQLGRIVGNVWAGIKALARAALPAGQGLLDSFEQATAKLRELNDEAEQNKLVTYFNDVAENVRAIADLIGEAGLDALSLGDNPGIAETANILREDLLPIIKDLLETGIDKHGPMLADAVVSIAEAFKELSDAGALETFVGIIEDFADVITGLMNNPVTRPLITWLVQFEAALAALVLIRNFSGIGQLVGFVTKLSKVDWKKIIAGIAGVKGAEAAGGAASGAASTAGAAGAAAAAGGAKKGLLARAGAGLAARVVAPAAGALAAVGASAAAALGPILLIVAGIAALVGIFIAAYKNSEELRNAIDRFKVIAQAAWQIISTAVADAWNNYIAPALAAFAEWIGDKLAVAINWLTNFIITSWPVISAAIQFAWNNVIKPVFEALSNFITEVLVPVISWLWSNVIEPAFKGIGSAISFAWDKVIKPAFEALNFIITKVIIPVITWLWKNVVAPAFSGIQLAISIAWAAIKIIFDAISYVIRTVVAPVINWLWKTIVQPAFSGIGTAISWTWNNVIKPVFNTLGNFIRDTVVPAFETGVDGIKTAWNSIKEIAAKPINFVIGTVYNSGIRSVFNKIADAVGSKTRLPYMNQIATRARGGYTPPGMTLVGENGPELVNFSKSGWVYGASATKKLMNGPVLGGGLSWEGIKGAIAGAKDWVLGNLKRAAGKLLDPIRRLMSGVGGDGIMGNIVRGSIKKAIDMVIGFGGDKDKAAELVAATFHRTGRWPAPVRGRVSANTLAAAAFVRKTFGIDNIGTLGSRPNKSDHPMGKAIDSMIPGWKTAAGIALGNRIANYFTTHPGAFGTKYVIWRDKINTGGGWRPYVHPSGNTVNPTLRHMDHVHTSLYDSGGWLKPGLTLVENRSGRPEPVLTADQWERLIGAVERGGVDGAHRASVQNTWYVYNPVQEKTSQTVVRESTRIGSLGAF